MLLHSNILTQPPKVILSNDEIEEELEQYQNNCRAVYHRITATYTKVFKAIQEEKDNSLQLAFFFRKFLEGVAESKADRVRLQKQRKVLLLMKKRWEVRREREKRKEVALKRAQFNRMQKVFSEWNKVVNLQKWTRTLFQWKLSESSKEFFLLLRENKQRNTIQKLQGLSSQIVANSVHAKTLKNTAFLGLVVNLKMCRVQRSRKSLQFRKIISSIRSHNKYATKFIFYRNRRLLFNCLSFLKQNYFQAVAERFRRRSLLSSSFSLWKSSLQYLTSQKQLEKSNQCIANIFRERKTRALLFRVLCAWRQQAKQAKQLRHHNSVLNKYADLKYKELLLRRCFQLLKANRINSQIKTQYYQVKLKRKVIESLKLAICQSLIKEEKIINFIEKMERRKYFDRIRQFNQIEKEKVMRFRMKFLFKAFTFTIVLQYYQKQNRAIAYHNNSLLFRSIFALKEEASFTKKAQFCIIYINAILPLRRWNRRHRLTHHQQQKKWLTCKKIFRQWRLLVVRRHSQRKLTREFKLQDSQRAPIPDDSKLQAFEFDNIMATIAKIRSNFLSERQDTLKNESGRWPAIHTPSQEVDFSYSRDNQQDLI